MTQFAITTLSMGCYVVNLCLGIQSCSEKFNSKINFCDFSILIDQQSCQINPRPMPSLASSPGLPLARGNKIFLFLSLKKFFLPSRIILGEEERKAWGRGYALPIESYDCTGSRK